MRKLRKLGITSLLAVSFVKPVQAGSTYAGPMGFERLFLLDIQDLSKITVNTVSNVDETLRDAPATTIVITREELLARGYRNLSQIYDDLPGMDVIRPYGDVYFANYWRGLRNNLGSPYLLLLDGVVQNDLYYNAAEMIVTLPISAVSRIEVVYGPASVIYGANAFAGVVNVITRHGGAETGFHSSGEIKAGSFGTRISDVYSSYGNGDFSASVAARYDVGHTDDRFNNDYEWTKDHYYANPSLWGEFAGLSKYGEYDSPHRNAGFDLRVSWRDTEFAAQYFMLNSGYGSEYPADIAQNHAWWNEQHDSLSLTHKEYWSDSVSGKTMFRYRTSGVDNDSDFLEAYNQANNSRIERVVRYSLWGIDSDSTSIVQDLEWQASERWHFNGGLRYEEKKLQKAAKIAYGPALTPDLADPGSYEYPSQPDHSGVADNLTRTTDKGIYGVASYRLPELWDFGDMHILNAGFRVDDNSFYGSETTFRGGYVSHYGDFTLKIMAVGESYQEPTPRTLYSGWAGSGSDPDLKPESATTSEVSLEYTQPDYRALLSVYRMHTRNTIINFAGGAANAGEGIYNGADLHLIGRLPLASGEWLRVWAYYSYLDTDEAHENSFLMEDSLGDTARHKLHLGLMWPFKEYWQSSLRARYIGERNTVATNPVGEVDGYTTADINLIYKIPENEGLRLALSIENLFDHRYFHPGVRQADAGETPGYFDEQGVWQGSKGYFSSLLPQEGRGVFASLLWDF